MNLIDHVFRKWQVYRRQRRMLTWMNIEIPGQRFTKHYSDATWGSWLDWLSKKKTQLLYPAYFFRGGGGGPLVNGGFPWWRHQMEAFSALPALCAGNSPLTGEFPSQRPVTRSFDVFFDLRLNKRLSKQSRRRRFETPSLWRHCYGAKAFSCHNVVWCIFKPQVIHYR